MKRLKDESNFLAAQARETSVIQRRSGHSVQQYLARGGKVHCTRQIQQRRLAAAAPSDQRNEFALLNLKRHSRERTDLLSVGEIVLVYFHKR